MTASRCLLASRGVVEPTKEAQAGAMFESEFMLSVTAFIQGLAKSGS